MKNTCDWTHFQSLQLYWKMNFSLGVFQLFCLKFQRNSFIERLVFWLFIKPGILKRGTKCRKSKERGEHSVWFLGISLRIPGSVFILTIAGMPEKIPRNVPEDFGECSRNIPGNVTKDFGLLFYFKLFSHVWLILAISIVIRNGKGVWKLELYCWYFCLNLTFLGWRTQNTSK